jgi:hypothetical protein
VASLASPRVRIRTFVSQLWTPSPWLQSFAISLIPFVSRVLSLLTRMANRMHLLQGQPLEVT